MALSLLGLSGLRKTSGALPIPFTITTAPLLVAKPSPGKGTGIFTTAAVLSGTLILVDSPVIYLKGTVAKTYKDTERILLGKIKALDAADRARFYALHEGPRAFATREMRIFKANAFGDGVDEWVYFDSSYFNHSCVLNAWLTSCQDDRVAEVYAIRDLAAGEEVFINYNDYLLDGATRLQRRGWLRGRYGFECQSGSCAAGEDEVAISDMRRAIANDLGWKLKGKVPVDCARWDMLTSDVGERPFVGRSTPLSAPLTAQQHTAYSLLYAAVCEAEGLGGVAVAIAYADAAEWLFRQVMDEQPVTVLASVKLAQVWVDKSVAIWKKATGSSTRDALQNLPVAELVAETIVERKLDLALRGLADNPNKADGTPKKSFAVKWWRDPRGGSWHFPLDRAECLAELRKHGGDVRCVVAGMD